MPLTAAEVNAELEDVWPASDYEVLALSATHALTHQRLADGKLRPGGFIPGPAQFAIADAALWYLVFGAIDRIELMAVTSELSIRFLRPGTGARLFAEATLERAGRRAVVGSVRVWTDENRGRPCATAQGTYALP